MLFVSLTDFVDFAIKSGPAQLTKVKQFAARGEYDPRADFWKPLREAIVDFHRGKRALDSVLTGLTDPKKVNRYPDAVARYKKYISKNQPKWFKPPSAVWTYGQLSVRINPEIGFELKNVRYAVKLHFKDEKLTKQRLRVVFELMSAGLQPYSGLVPAVLELGSTRLFVAPSSDGSLRPFLEAQAIAFVHMWEAVTKKSAAAQAGK